MGSRSRREWKNKQEEHRETVVTDISPTVIKACVTLVKRLMPEQVKLKQRDTTKQVLLESVREQKRLRREARRQQRKAEANRPKPVRDFAGRPSSVDPVFGEPRPDQPVGSSRKLPNGLYVPIIK